MTTSLMALVNSFDGFILDYGGVLARHQTEADQARLANLAGVPRHAFAELYWSKRPDYDRGLITGPEYWQSIAKLFGNRLSAHAIDQLIEFDNVSWMQFDSVMWDWIDQLHAAGKRMAMLSNMPRELGDVLIAGTRKLNAFDHLTLSYHVHAVKPEPVVYEHCLEGLGTAPETTLFLDDRIENVQGAELFGIRAIQFTSSDEILLRLRN